jgi:transporter family protein
LASVVGQLFFYQALKGDHIGRVPAVGGSWPVFAFFLSLIFLKEPPTVKKILGVALVAMGVALLK